ncbi:hypothetical protein QBC33DRAFT_551703 [Phialemonium atrogriseum]|uniref:Uncharacterized protein n=1 Tax=Phialemonium atrogriseum TaxID=1093897 RepID=A0AAJ0BR40_9PEZI|nr:uncharacterized protein QBC33DRAFT_551703 [Phialemonium atrogriseum]KAK1762497.1 hypothetical protein QBC33DRAFT_551703 [Phialemonium atrogriseum]
MRQGCWTSLLGIWLYQNHVLAILGMTTIGPHCLTTRASHISCSFLMGHSSWPLMMLVEDMDKEAGMIVRW